jgi:hypothetical protein
VITFSVEHPQCTSAFRKSRPIAGLLGNISSGRALPSDLHVLRRSIEWRADGTQSGITRSADFNLKALVVVLVIAGAKLIRLD